MAPAVDLEDKAAADPPFRDLALASRDEPATVAGHLASAANGAQSYRR